MSVSQSGRDGSPLCGTALWANRVGRPTGTASTTQWSRGERGSRPVVRAMMLFRHDILPKDPPLLEALVTHDVPVKRVRMNWWRNKRVVTSNASGDAEMTVGGNE